jgi:archaellum biogenesis ATPase FlaH
MDVRDYSEDVQKLLVSVLLSDEEVFSRCVNILNVKYFVNKLRPAVRFLLQFANEYKCLPTHEQMRAQFGMEFERMGKLAPALQQAFLDQIEEFCKNRALADAVLSAPDLIAKGAYGEVEKRVKEAILVGLNSNIGIRYYDDPRSRLMKIKQGNGQISSSWKTVDAKLYGGLNRKEITIWCAGSGGGKSVTMQNQAVLMSRAGLNVVYISLELSEEMISMRLDSMVSGVGTREIFQRLDDVEIRVLQAGKKAADLHVKQMPQGTTTNDLRAYLKNYEIETGRPCDVLMVDYLDLMFPNNKKIDISNLYIKDKFITEELRGLCVEKNMVGITASQLGRSSVDSMEFDHSHIAGGISKIQTADNVIAILATPAMRERGQYQFQFLKTRSSSGVGSKIIMGFDPETLRIYDLEEGEAPPVKTAADMMADLRRKNSGTTGASVPVPDRRPDPVSQDPVRSVATLKELTSLIRR